MSISVVIPVWNRKDLLVRALNSVQQQTHQPLEIIVVDDGSTDGVGEMVLEKYPEITLLTQNNLGVSAARNLGIKHASGEWIAFLDSDDEWLPDKLSKQVAWLSRHLDYRICHTDEIWIRHGVRVNPMVKHGKPEGWIFNQCLALCCVSPSSILIHRNVFDNIGMFDQSLPACEDYDLWLRVFRCYRAGLVNEHLLIKYGGHEDQLSRKFWGMDRFRVTALVKMLQSGLLDNKQKQSCATMLSKKCAILSKGFEKRYNYTEAKRYQKLRDLWNPISTIC